MAMPTATMMTATWVIRTKSPSLRIHPQQMPSPRIVGSADERPREGWPTIDYYNYAYYGYLGEYLGRKIKVAVAEVVDIDVGDCECAAAGGGWSVGRHCRSRAPRIEMTVGLEVRGRESLVWPTACMVVNSYDWSTKFWKG